jgi:hypothetical protein
MRKDELQLQVSKNGARAPNSCAFGLIGCEVLPGVASLRRCFPGAAIGPSMVAPIFSLRAAAYIRI